MAGIVLSIEVDDKGTVKVKQLADESKKAFKEMEQAPKKARGALNDLRDSWVGLTAKIGLFTAALYAAKRMTYDFALGIASAASDIERQAAALGISTDEFQRWQYIARMTDVESTSLTMGLRYLADQMGQAAKGTGEASEYLRAMGVRITDASGRLRPLMAVVEDIADSMSKWKDGTDKLNYAIQIFGQRAGQQFIGLLNEGKAGIRALGEEAEKTGAIVRKDLIGAGAEAEESFKRLSMQWQAFKLSLGPAAKELADFFDTVKPYAEKILWIFQQINELSEAQRRLYERLGILTPREYFDITKPKIGPPMEVPIPKDISKEARKIDLISDSMYKFQQIYMAGIREGEVKIDGMIYKIDALAKANEEAYKENLEMITYSAQYQTELLDQQAAKYKEYANLRIEAERRMNEEIVRLGLGFEAPTEEYKLMVIEEEIKEREKLAKKTSEWAQAGEMFATNLSAAWRTNVVSMIKDSENFTDAVKNMFAGIGDAFINVVSEMIVNWVLFGSVMGLSGAKSTGSMGGLFGLFGMGKLFGLKEGGIISGWKPILPFQEGGVINRPTLGMIGEGGAEAVIPLKGGKIPVEGSGRSTINAFYIYANDPVSFRDFVRKNPEAIIEAVHNNERVAGTMSKLGY